MLTSAPRLSWGWASSAPACRSGKSAGGHARCRQGVCHGGCLAGLLLALCSIYSTHAACRLDYALLCGGPLPCLRLPLPATLCSTSPLSCRRRRRPSLAASAPLPILPACRVKPWISKDYDVVVSCISLLVGGILIFQASRGTAPAWQHGSRPIAGCRRLSDVCSIMQPGVAVLQYHAVHTAASPRRTPDTAACHHPAPRRLQGWRLDPLLLFGQLMTTGAAVSFAIEALRLRSEAYEGEVSAPLLPACALLQVRGAAVQPCKCAALVVRPVPTHHPTSACLPARPTCLPAGEGCTAGCAEAQGAWRGRRRQRLPAAAPRRAAGGGAAALERGRQRAGLGGRAAVAATAAAAAAGSRRVSGGGCFHVFAALRPGCIRRACTHCACCSVCPSAVFLNTTSRTPAAGSMTTSSRCSSRWPAAHMLMMTSSSSRGGSSRQGRSSTQEKANGTMGAQLQQGSTRWRITRRQLALTGQQHLWAMGMQPAAAAGQLSLPSQLPTVTAAAQQQGKQPMAMTRSSSRGSGALRHLSSRSSRADLPAVAAPATTWMTGSALPCPE